MSGYPLDTNTISYLADMGSPHNTAVTARLAETPADAEIGISILTFYEVAFAAERVAAFANLSALIESEFDVHPLPLEGADGFVSFKTGLAARWGAAPKKLARHNTDLMIAATAVALDLTLVSNDSIFRDLAQIDPRLTVEDWTT